MGVCIFNSDDTFDIIGSMFLYQNNYAIPLQKMGAVFKQVLQDIFKRIQRDIKIDAFFSFFTKEKRMNPQSTVYMMAKSYKYNMFGAYKRVDHGTYWTFHYMKHHRNNRDSAFVRSDTTVPKTDTNHIDFYYVSAE